MEQTQQTTCLLIASCDAYSDAWPPFFALLFRYWPDCPYPIYLISNHQSSGVQGVQTIALGEDRKWASNMLTALKQLPHDRILYFQEDYFLQNRVSNAKLDAAHDLMTKTGAGFIRLSGGPDPEQPHENSLHLGVLSPGQKFRVSLQAALWRRSTLMKLLVEGESGWDMEIQGSRRSDELDELFLGVWSRLPIIDYYKYTGILKGKWVPGALRLCLREGIEVDTSRRETHSEWPFLVREFRNTPVIRACRQWWKKLRKRAA